MRLICPNCGAQYEVPDEVIPESGRDVQCSNCGDTWFQAHPDHPHAGDTPAAADTDLQPEDEQDWVEEPESEEPAPAPATEESRRELDPDVANVLREEASREAEARAAEGRRGGLETQPDLGLSDAEDEKDRRSHQAKARMARLRGRATPEEEPRVDEDEDEDDIDPGSRRSLLPDIEEINSSISTKTDDGSADASARDGSRVQHGKKPSSGEFRRGLRLAIGLALIATAAYMFAPQFAEMVPAAAGPLNAYVEAVDAGRIALDEQLGGVSEMVRGLIGG